MRHAPFHHAHRREPRSPHNSSATISRCSIAASISATCTGAKREYAARASSRRALPASRPRSFEPHHRRRAAAIRCPIRDAFARRLGALGVGAGIADRRLRPGQRRATRRGSGGWRAGSACATSRCSTVASPRGAPPGLPLETHGAHAAAAHARRCRSTRCLGRAAQRSTSCGMRPGNSAGRRARRGALRRAQRDHRSGRGPRSRRAQPSLSRQSRRRRKIPARRGAAPALDTLLGSHAAVRADRHVRLGSHRLPQPARARTRRPAGCASVCRLVERMDPRSAPARSPPGAY